MAQATDYNLANQTGADFRAELNEILAASVSLNSGSSEPTTMYAHQLWVDTSSNVLKIRNAANNAWLTTGVSITASNTFDINAGTINGITSLSFSSGATVASILFKAPKANGLNLNLKDSNKFSNGISTL